MRKKEEEVLRQLEKALLEDLQEEEIPQEEDPTEWVDEYYDDLEEEILPPDFTVRNSDRVDVDLDDYSEEVYQAKKGGCLIPGLITLLALCVLAAMVLWLLQYLEVM